MERKTVRNWGGRLLLGCLVLILVGASSAFAQIDTGSILGTVSDSSGARINGATVTLVNEGTNATLATTSGEDGGYKITPVRIGSYKLTVTMQGFQTATTNVVAGNVGQNHAADFSMKPDSRTQAVARTTV